MPNRREVYLDENATTRVLSAAANRACAVMEKLYGNPSSSHITGLQARQILESARTVARKVLGAPQGRIVFTSGATEAIQTGVFSALCALKQRQKPQAGGLLLYGATEHKAVPQALKHWSRLLDLGCEVLAVPVDSRGQLDLAFLQQHIGQAHLLCTMAVNNETGAVHDLAAIQRIVAAASNPVYWLVDCVQAVGKLALNLEESRIDYAPISGHKIYAPKGIGILYVREGAPFTPLLAGGGQEGGARGGTENLPGVAAIATVLEELHTRQAGLFANADTLLGYRDRLIRSLEASFPTIQFNTPFDNAVPTTINFSVPGVAGKELLDLFDAAGIRASSGSACGSAVQGSYVLEAMGFPKWRSDGAIRLSFGPATQASDIEAACVRLEEAGPALAKSCVMGRGTSDASSTRSARGLIQLKSGSNCSWVLSDPASRKCVVVDPFEELLGRIVSVVRCQELEVHAVLDTHQHVDHESPRKQLVDQLGGGVADREGTVDILGWPAAADGQVVLGDGSQAPVLALSESLVIAKTALPGHTVDGQAYLAGEAVDASLPAVNVRFAFTGDTLLIGGIGRTDFASSAAQAMLESLRKLPRVVHEQSIVCQPTTTKLAW